jgi:MFS family permease
MIAVRLERALGARGVHFGWVVAATVFFTMLVTAGAVGAPGLLLVPWEREFGWAPSQISSALALRFLLYGLVGPFAAVLLNRYGVRRIVVCALALVTFGLLASLAMDRLWQLVLLWGILVGVGTGLTAMVLGATVATRWFSKRRGLVVGVLSASTATGQLVFLPLLARLTQQHGWRYALGGLCLMLIAATLISLLLLRDRPGDIGLAPYGEVGPSRGAQDPSRGEATGGVLPATASGRAISLGAVLFAPLAVLREAARTRVFWVLFGTFFICGASTNGLVQTHFIALCGDYGLPAVGAAGVLAMMGVFDFGGTIFSGWLSDRFDNRWLLAWYYGLRGLSLLGLPLTQFTFTGLAPFAMFYGLDWIATVPPTVRLTAERFGRERANVVFGWIFTGHQLGAASAAYGAGLTRTLTGSYLPAFVVSGLLCIVATLILFTVPGIGAKRAQPIGATT